MNRPLMLGLASTLMLLSVVTLSATGVAETDAETILQFGLSGNPDTLDPHTTSGTLTFQTIRSFYDTLVEPDRSGVLVPALAESWDVSSDKISSGPSRCARASSFTTATG